MRKFIFFALLTFSAHLIYCQPPAIEEPGYDMATRLRQNVVSILTRKDATLGETGFGFIVSVKDGHAYIVTASHVVSDADTIIVNYFGHEDVPYLAEDVRLDTDAIDISLLKVNVPEQFTWEPKCYSEYSIPSSRTFYIGKSGRWYIPTGNAAGSINDITLDSRIILDMRVWPGTSGAPLINQGGIIGLIIRDDFSTSEAIHIDLIRHIIRNVFRHSFDLQHSAPNPDQIHYSGTVMPGLIKKLREAPDDMEASETLTSILEELMDPSRDRGEFIKVKERFSDAVAHRLKNTRSRFEISNLFEAIDEYVNIDSTFGDDILKICDEVLEEEFMLYKNYLGELLLEGYKKCLIKNRNIRPRHDHTREIYQFVMRVSDQSVLERNMLLAQLQLLNDGVLNCNERLTRRTGWETKYREKIPSASLAHTDKQLVRKSILKDTVLNEFNQMFVKRKKAINTFDYKLNRFRNALFVRRNVIGSKIPLFFEAKVLTEGKCYECLPFNFVFDDRFLR